VQYKSNNIETLNATHEYQHAPKASHVHTLETTVTPPHKSAHKKVADLRYKKALGQVISGRLQEFEANQPKDKRGEWNHKIALRYEPKPGDEHLWEYVNRYGDPIMQPTDEEARISATYNPEKQGNQKRWARMANCVSKIEKVYDAKEMRHTWVKRNKCRDKACPICSHDKSMRMAHKYLPSLQAMNNPVMLVLHERNCEKGTLAETMANMYADWRLILQQASKRKRGYSGIVSWEVTTNEKAQTFHPHMHIIVESEHAPRILEDWIKRNPAKRTHHAHMNNGQNMQPVSKDIKSLFEVLKYTMKLSISTRSKEKDQEKEMASTEMLYEIVCAMYKKPQWKPFGQWIKQQEETHNNEERVIDIDENPEIQACDKWVWDNKLMDWVGSPLQGITMQLVNEPLPASFYTFTRLKPPS